MMITLFLYLKYMINMYKHKHGGLLSFRTYALTWTAINIKSSALVLCFNLMYDLYAWMIALLTYLMHN